jgi:hypothetical protein
MSHVGHATFGSSTTNTLHKAESLGYMLLARPICELSVLEQCCAACANVLDTRIAHVAGCDEKAWALKVRYESR